MNKTVYPITGLVILCLALAGCGSPAAPAALGIPTAIVGLPASSETPAATPPPQPVQATARPQATAGPQAAKCSPIPLAKSMPVMSSSDYRSEIALLDPANGLPACDARPLEFNGPVTYAFSSDLKKLAIVAYRGADYHAGVLYIVDVTAWQAVTTTLQSLENTSLMVFNPSGEQLAIAEYLVNSGKPPASRLDIVDLATQNVVAQKSLDYAPRAMAYSAGGTRLGVFGATDNASHGTKPQAHVQLFDSASLDVAWEPSLPGVLAGMSLPKDSNADPIFDQWEPGVAFSADGSLLYIDHSEADVLTKVDFEHQTQASMPIRPKMSWSERLLQLGALTAQAKGMNGTVKQAQVSPDGTRLYVLGNTFQTTQDSRGNYQFNQIPLGLQVIDPASGVELGKVASDASGFSLSPDGRAIFLYNWDNAASTEIVDAASLKVTQRQDQGAVLIARLLDGEAVTLLQLFTQLSQLDPQSLRAVGKPWYTANYTLMTGSAP